ncbi:MAG: hypothetical protein JST00_48285 [Deltaproteobacteria bacterium]|nr:hypothetical protein [Deltaproteobacteria bacterium]
MRRIGVGVLGAAAVALAACGVDVFITVEDRPPSEDASSPDGTPGEGGPGIPDGGPGLDSSTDGGSDADASQVAVFGDASVIAPSRVDLLVGAPRVPVVVTLVKDTLDPAELGNVVLQADPGEITVTPPSPTTPPPTSRTFEVETTASAAPHRAKASLVVTVGTTTQTLPITFVIARYFRIPSSTPITIPADTPPTSYEVELWGAGGAGSSNGASGGGGGFARGTATLVGQISVVVGGQGEPAMGGMPGGGAGNVNPEDGPGGGGGYSGIFKDNDLAQSGALVIAGGGGGGGGRDGNGGAGGAHPSGGGAPGFGSGMFPGGPGGSGGGGQGGATTNVGGTLLGGAGLGIGAGGGGGGYFGGGGGGAASGGGGGASFSRLTLAPLSISATFKNASGATPGEAANPRRLGAGEPGKPGAVLIRPL